MNKRKNVTDRQPSWLGPYGPADFSDINPFKGSQLTLDVSQHVVELFFKLHKKLNTEDWEELDNKLVDFFEKMSYKYPSNWECPINYQGCERNCGDYACGN